MDIILPNKSVNGMLMGEKFDLLKNCDKFKIFKERQLNKVFIKVLMRILAAVPKKQRKITKKGRDLKQKHKNIAFSQKLQNQAILTPLKSCSIHETQTKMQEETILCQKAQIVSLNLNYFQSYNPYTLGSINSIVFNNGRIYDLLLVKKQNLIFQKKIKCRCSKSKCSVKYCDCFSNGQACGDSCQCVNCLNLVNNQLKSKSKQDCFCRCSKSQCQKNYCQCFQRGKSCSSKCRCENCKNTSGSVSNSKF